MSAPPPRPPPPDVSPAICMNISKVFSMLGTFSLVVKECVGRLLVLLPFCNDQLVFISPENNNSVPQCAGVGPASSCTRREQSLVSELLAAAAVRHSQLPCHKYHFKWTRWNPDTFSSIPNVFFCYVTSFSDNGP